MARLEQDRVKLNKSKCQLLKSEVRYLGHLVSAKGIQPVPDKVEAMRNAPRPINVIELQNILGLV